MRRDSLSSKCSISAKPLGSRGRLLNVRIVCESKYLQHVGSQQQRTVREGWGYQYSVDLCER